MTADVDPSSDLVASILSKIGDFASPAAGRNALPLAVALAPILPDAGTVLEVASGNGFHAAFLAAYFPHLTWQPTEGDSGRLGDMQDLAGRAQLPNLLSPLSLDATSTKWPVNKAQAVLCLNMIHIAPWPAAEGLMNGVARVLETNAALFLYGPFKVGGQHTAPSNAVFDQNLKQRDPNWGVRNDEDVDRLAETNGLGVEGVIEMPANNMIRVYRKIT